MTSDRKKAGVAFWAAVALVVVLVGYPLAWGPTAWLLYNVEMSEMSGPGEAAASRLATTDGEALDDAGRDHG